MQPHGAVRDELPYQAVVKARESRLHDKRLWPTLRVHTTVHSTSVNVSEKLGENMVSKPDNNKGLGRRVKLHALVLLCGLTGRAMTDPDCSNTQLYIYLLVWRA